MARFWYRLNRRTIIQLGLLTVIVAAWLPPPRPAFGQAGDDVYELDLAALGYATEVLVGPHDKANYHFSLPANWLPQAYTSLQLNLIYATSNETSAAPAQLKVVLNGEVLHTEYFQASTTTSLNVGIPPEKLRLAEDAFTNRLELELLVHAQCEEALGTILTVQSSSTLRFVYRERPLNLDLALYPKPLYHKFALEATPVHIVLPPRPTASELEMTAITAANLGAQTNDNLSLEITLGDRLPVTATRQHLLVIGSPERAALLSQLDLPLPLRQRRSHLGSQMPATVTPARPFSYTLIVGNTASVPQEFSVEDRLSPLAHVEACQGCSQIAPDLLRWEVGALAPGQTISTVVQIRPDESLGIGEPIEHTASLLDAAGQVINVDTLSTIIAPESDGTVVSSPVKGPTFFALDGQGVPETDGIVQLLVSPWSARRALLVITGLNDAAVLHGTHALATPGSMPGMQGQFAIVQATRPLTVSTTSPSQDITLAELGHADIVSKGRAGETELRLDVPRGWKLTEEAYVALHLAHGMAFNTIPATLELSLNGMPFHSVALQAENAMDSWVTIPLPSQRLKPGSNRLNLQISADWPACIDDDDRARLWATIYADSFLHLSYTHQAAGYMYDLADYPGFLSTQPGLQDVTLLLPAQVTPDEVQGMVRLLSFLGDAVQGEYFNPQVALASEVTAERWHDEHLIVLGQPTRNPYIPLVNDRLPQPFVPGRDEIRQQIDRVIYRLPPGYDLGFVQLLPVPWNTDWAMLVATGTTEVSLRWALRALADRDLNRQMRGNLAAMVSADEVRTTDTRQSAIDRQSIIPPLDVSTLIPEAAPTLTDTPTSATTSTPVPFIVTPPVYPTGTVASASPGDARPSGETPRWIIGVLAFSILVMAGGVGVTIRRRRSRIVDFPDQDASQSAYAHHHFRKSVTKPEYVFVVGSFRSGTTLVRNILNSSEEVGICWETHFFGHFISPGYIKEIRNAGDLSNDANVHKAVDYMYNFGQGYWRWLKENVDKATFTQRLLETDRSDRAIFNLMMQLYAGDKPIMGEKTPSHLYHVPTLLDWFPNAKVIHTFRDPRAIFVSELKKKTQPRFASARHKRLQRAGLLVPYILLQVTLTWLRAAYLHQRYQKLYPDRYWLIRLEDLLSAPEHYVELLGDFLNTELPPQVLESVPSNSSFPGRRDRSGIDTEAANRWREQINPWINRWFLFWCRKQLIAFAYI